MKNFTYQERNTMRQDAQTVRLVVDVLNARSVMNAPTVKIGNNVNV